MIGLIGWLVASLATGAIGALATRRARDFYAGLVRPRWSPPGWLFGPVWTALYLMMGVAAWLVWRRAGWGGAAIALSLFIAQLICNAAWSWLFFAWRRGAWAFADIVLLAGLVVATMLAFARVHRLAAPPQSSRRRSRIDLRGDRALTHAGSASLAALAGSVPRSRCDARVAAGCRQLSRC